MEEPLDKPRRRCTPYEFFLNVCGEHCQKKGIEKDFKGKGNKDRLMEEHVITISDNEDASRV